MIIQLHHLSCFSINGRYAYINSIANQKYSDQSLPPLVASIIPVCYLVRNLNATCQNIVLVCYLGKPHKGQKFKLFNKQKMHVFTDKLKVCLKYFPSFYIYIVIISYLIQY